MSLIEIRNLTFAYPGSFDNVFEGLNLRLDTSWRLGLVGRNGRGKTTLLRLLLGEYEYSGAISAPAELAYFPPRVAHPEADTRAVLEELAPGLEEWRLLRELAALEVDEEVLDRPFSTLSGGEQVKALLSVLFLREGAFPLLDEPTNHLDLEGRQLVSRWLSRKEGFLLISHDRAFLDGCVDHIAAINKKDVEVRQGDFSAWWRDKQARDDWERAENSRLKKEIGRLEDAARRTASWSDRVEATKKGSRNAGLRPDRAVIVYANKVREAFGDIPLIIGGLEASLRRFAHYDYWEDKVRRAVLFDSQADLLVYGMGETATREIAARLASGTPIGEITDVKGTAFIAKDPSACAYPKVECPSFEEVSTCLLYTSPSPRDRG